jgi:hypothetical protein
MTAQCCCVFFACLTQTCVPGKAVSLELDLILLLYLSPGLAEQTLPSWVLYTGRPTTATMYT